MTDEPAAKKSSQAQKPSRIALKLVRWCVCGVIAALVPFALAWVELKTDRPTVTAFDLFRRGDLLLVSTGIGFAAAGELYGVNAKYAVLKVFAGGLSAILALFEAGIYAWAHTLHDPYNGGVITSLSVETFWVTATLGFACIILSELEESEKTDVTSN